MRSVNVAQPTPTPDIRERQREGSWNGSGTGNDSGLARESTRYESWSGTGESSVHGTASDSEMVTPELTPPSTPDASVHLPIAGSSSAMDKVFRLAHFRPTGGGDKELPTPPDSEESDSAESAGHITPSTKPRSISIFGGPKSLRKEEGIVKQDKGWNSKWKFWKASLTTASA